MTKSEFLQMLMQDATTKCKLMYDNYLVTNKGDIYRLYKSCVTKMQPAQQGKYSFVYLTIDNKPKKFYVHRLVYMAFTCIDLHNLQVHHMQGKSNCFYNLIHADSKTHGRYHRQRNIINKANSQIQHLSIDMVDRYLKAIKTFTGDTIQFAANMTDNDKLMYLNTYYSTIQDFMIVDNKVIKYKLPLSRVI